MNFLVETDICSAYLRGNRRVEAKVFQYLGQLAVSSVTVAELKAWVFRRSAPARYGTVLLRFLDDLPVLAVDGPVADVAGRISAELTDRGQRVETPDLLIAATALVHDLTLVTHNVAHFDRIGGLRFTDWLDSP